MLNMYCRAAAVVVVIVVACVVFGQTKPAADTPSGATAVITGANRGIGLAFARRLKADGFRVIGTARQPDAADELRALGVRIEQLDVTDADSVRRLADAIGDMPVDVLINNAGIGGGWGRPLKDVDIDDAERILQVNCLGPMRVTQALLPALRKGDIKFIINITSMLGSIEGNTRGGSYGYRESKAALNMFTRSLAAELEPDGFTCIAMSPGWVKTDMGGPNARLTPDQSVDAMVKVIEGLSTEHSGSFFNHAGELVPW